jgi:hypothetical protein
MAGPVPRLHDRARIRILEQNGMCGGNFDAKQIGPLAVTLQLGSGIDCDVHPAVPSLAALFPYLEDHWREIVVTRGLDDLDTISYPPNAPISCRPDWRPRAGTAPTLAAWQLTRSIISDRVSRS